MTRFVQQTLLAAALAAAFGVAGAEEAKKPAAMTPAAAGAAKDAKPPVAIDKNKVSTMVGMDIGRGLAQIKDDIDIKVVEQALEQTLKGEKTSLTQEEALQVRQAYMQQMQAKRVAEQKAAAEKNKTEGTEFLAKNKSKSGVKTTASDVLRFLEANMRLAKLDDKWQRAVTQTHTGYYRAGSMTQDLIWEQYAYPVALDALLQGNSAAVILNPTPVSRIAPPQTPSQDVWINKTGSTNGFGAYIAFVPEKRLGIVLLANKNFPIDERVRAAYQILSAFESAQR